MAEKYSFQVHLRRANTLSREKMYELIPIPNNGDFVRINYLELAIHTAANHTGWKQFSLLTRRTPPCSNHVKVFCKVQDLQSFSICVWKYIKTSNNNIL